MAVFDREGFRRSRRAHRSGAVSRDGARVRPRVQPELAAANRRMRAAQIRTLEGALAQAGVDVRALRVALARNRKPALDAVAALRSNVAASPSSPGPGTAPLNRFRSLQALNGRVVPLDQPSSLSFLQEPFDLFVDEDLNYLVSSSTALGDVYFSTKILASRDAQYANYTFAYDWYNDSDSSVLLTISTSLEFFGSLYGEAYGAGADTCWDARTECDIYGALALSTGSDYDPEDRISTITTFVVDSGWLGLGKTDGSQWFNHEDHGISMDGYLVPPNAAVEIDVTTSFSFFFGWEGSPEDLGFVDADFAGDGGRISCPGVIVIATPLTTIF